MSERLSKIDRDIAALESQLRALRDTRNTMIEEENSRPKVGNVFVDTGGTIYRILHVGSDDMYVCDSVYTDHVNYAIAYHAHTVSLGHIRACKKSSQSDFNSALRHALAFLKDME